jgi:Flp pilus assembly protein TadB
MLFGLIAICLLVILVAYYKLSKIRKKNRMRSRKKKNSNFFENSYVLFSKIIFINKYLIIIEKSIKSIELSDKKTINKKVAKFIYISICITSVLVVILIENINSLYFLLLSLLIVYIVNTQLLDFYVNKIENILLIQFEIFLSDVKHYYHEHKMIDEAIYDTTRNVTKSNFEMSLHAKKMYEILSSEDVENEIDKYYDVAPNRFFKNFIALANLVQKFGDKQVDEKSIFLTNINYLKQEIKYELLRKEKLDHLFKSLSLITVIPIFFIKPLEKWSTSNLPELKYYYEGSYGFVIQILVFILVIISYMLINKMKAQKKIVMFHEKTITGRILENRKIDRIINFFIYKRYSKFLKYKKNLKNAGYNKNIKEFYLQKLIFGILAFLFTVLVFVNVINISKGQINNSNEENKAVLLLDTKYIEKLNDEKFTYIELKNYVDSNENLSEKELNVVSERIYKKINKYNGLYFKWWYLIIAIINSIIGYNIPLMFIEFKKRVMKMNIEDEVLQMHTIILMVMYFQRISVEEVLKWMEQFAVVFKQSIGQCINEMEQGDIEALEKLKREESYPPFVKIVDNLINASEKISLSLAFDELILERKYYQDKRKQDTEMLIEKKGALGKFIAFVPLGFTMLFYLLIPFLLLSYNQLLNYSNQINSIL